MGHGLLLGVIAGCSVPSSDPLCVMLQECFRDDLQPTLFTKGGEHFAKDFWLYVREEIDKSLERSIKFAEVGFVGFRVAAR
jgi:hypothetical protein